MEATKIGIGEVENKDAIGLLKLQIEFGADVAMQETPINHFETSRQEIQRANAAKKVQQSPQSPNLPGQQHTEQPTTMPTEAVTSHIDPVAEAQRMAASAQDLDQLRTAIAQFPHCKFREDARNLVFCDGSANARVMIVGEAPGAEEDRKGKPFVGKSGKLLDAMFAEIGLSRFSDDQYGPLYISNVVNWRPPGNKTPTKDDIDMFRPFIMKHIELIAPQVLVLLGNPSCQAILWKTGITRLRGHWYKHGDIDVRPSYHPAYLLRRATKRQESWQDLLAIKKRLRSVSHEQ